MSYKKVALLNVIFKWCMFRVEGYFILKRSINGLCHFFTVQEILKRYGSVVDSSILDSQVWLSLPGEIRALFSSLISSSYVMKSQPTRSSTPNPVYRSAIGKNYGNWIYNWTTKLVSNLSPTFAQEVFKACLPTLKHSPEINLHLLPTIVIVALCYRPSDRSLAIEIHEGMISVLGDHVPSDANHSDSLQSEINLHNLCTFCLFYVLDQLRKWLKIQCEKKTNRRKKERGKTVTSVDHEFEIVNGLVNSIPSVVIAHASHQCEDYTRALFHLERQLKMKPVQIPSQLGTETVYSSWRA